jgi:ribosome-associated protein
MRKLTDHLREAEKAKADDREMRSRTDEKRARRTLEDTLARLSKELVEQSAKRLEKLELPEDVAAAVHDAQMIASAPARNRQLRVVRGVLRAGDWALIQSRLEALDKHGTVAPLAEATDTKDQRAEELVVRLVGEGSETLDAFLAQHPHADRTYLRTLIRNVTKATADRRKKAEQKLAQALRSVLRG